MGGGERIELKGVPTLAALAALPRRFELLEKTIASLRPQVDRINVFINGYQGDLPGFLRAADEILCAAKNEGAERKFWWADKHEGLYFSCDDDITYPDNYVAYMVSELEQHPGHLVTAHGRVFLGRPGSVNEVAPGSVGIYHRRVDYGRPVNHGGTGVMCWDARAVKVPAASWPLENMADMQLACWAQDHRVPMWLVKHEAHWLKSDAIHDPKSLWKQSCLESHRSRSELLREQANRAPWRLNEC